MKGKLRDAFEAWVEANIPNWRRGGNHFGVVQDAFSAGVLFGTESKEKRQLPEMRMTPKEGRRIEDGWKNDSDAHELLGLIVAEFKSDPMSTQCFDLRIVQRAELCVAKRKAFVAADPLLREPPRG